jgi:hypothetical protein
VGRLWLVLAVVAVLGAPALAKREPACTDVEVHTLPTPGAFNVPTNARVWLLPANGTWTPVDHAIQPSDLQPQTHYVLDLPLKHTAFTTGGGRDDTAPTAPRIDNVSIALFKVIASDVPGSDGPEVEPTVPRRLSRLHISGLFDADTAVVRIDFEQGTETLATYYTTPDQLDICGLDVSLAPGTVTVVLVALDLAGNASPTVRATTTAVADDAERLKKFKWQCIPPARDEGLTPLLVVLSLLSLIVVLAAIGLRTRRAQVQAEPIALASLEYLARTVRSHAQLELAIIAAACAAVSVDTLGRVITATFPLLGWRVLLGLVQWAQARRFLRLLAYDGVTGQLAGDRASIVAGKQVASLRATPRMIARARRHALPKATL